MNKENINSRDEFITVKKRSGTYQEDSAVARRL